MAEKPYFNELPSEWISPPCDPSYHWETMLEYPPQLTLQPGFIRCNTPDIPTPKETEPEKPAAPNRGGITSLFKRSPKPPKNTEIVFTRWIITDRICPSPGTSAPSKHEASENVLADVLWYRDDSEKGVQLCIRSSSAEALQFQVLPRPEDRKRHGRKSCACHTRIVFWADVPGGGVWSGMSPIGGVRYLKVSLVVQGQKETRWMDEMFRESRDCDESEWVGLRERFEMRWSVPKAPDSKCLVEWKNKETR